jgi:hypothetical protein
MLRLPVRPDFAPAPVDGPHCIADVQVLTSSQTPERRLIQLDNPSILEIQYHIGIGRVLEQAVTVCECVKQTGTVTLACCLEAREHGSLCGEEMANQLYQHWVGQVHINAGDFTAANEPVDQWIPGAAPAGAASIAKDQFDDPIAVFPRVIRLRGHLGPLHVTVNVDLEFTGTIEYFRAPGTP